MKWKQELKAPGLYVAHDPTQGGDPDAKYKFGRVEAGKLGLRVNIPHPSRTYDPEGEHRGWHWLGPLPPFDA